MGEKGSKLNCVGCDTGLSMDQGEKLLVNGELVDILGLDDIMEQVRRMKLSLRRNVADELLARTKIDNKVPQEQEMAYRSALMDEYDRRYLSIM
jgi:hypothetical protein